MQHFQAAVASKKIVIFKPFHFSFGWNVVVAIGIVGCGRQHSYCDSDGNKIFEWR
jgi:hypothetical protein